MPVIGRPSRGIVVGTRGPGIPDPDS